MEIKYLLVEIISLWEISSSNCLGLYFSTLKYWCSSSCVSNTQKAILLLNIDRWFAFYLMTCKTQKHKNTKLKVFTMANLGYFYQLVDTLLLTFFSRQFFEVSFKSRDWRDLNKIQDGESHWIFSVVCHPTTVFDVYLKHDLKCNCINLSDSMYINSIYR